MSNLCTSATLRSDFSLANMLIPIWEKFSAQIPGGLRVGTGSPKHEIVWSASHQELSSTRRDTENRTRVIAIITVVMVVMVMMMMMMMMMIATIVLIFPAEADVPAHIISCFCHGFNNSLIRIQLVPKCRILPTMYPSSINI